ncbi:hypothetical protein [Enterococcus sp.]|jgi:hypothetical protein|uniref:hypothetical protein n=1 Tax=Enterococcus sp. TaxID=35783 RepID=UPI0025C59130|nr:hypothetical protein [Enterococcus sp.]
MKTKTTTRLTIRIQTPEAESPVSQTVNQVMNAPEEAKMIAFGEALAGFSKQASLASVVETIQNEYVK